MAYEFYLDGVLLPVAPSKLQIKTKNQNKTFNLIDGIEANILKHPGLTEITFEALLPQVEYPFSVYPNGFKGPKYYLDKLKALKINRKPFNFICSRVSPAGEYLFDYSFLASLEDYQITDDASAGTDITVSITLKEYIEFGTQTVTVNKPNKSKSTATAKINKTRSTASAPKKKTYTVKKGDTLWAIAKKYLGDGSRYMKIYNLNKSKIKSPNQLTVGAVLTLPS